jgi:glutathione S-transferase
MHILPFHFLRPSLHRELSTLKSTAPHRAMHLSNDSVVPSGNAYKVHLLLSQLKSPYTVTSLRLHPPHLESHTPEFLKINANGKVPALRLDDGTVLTESNAILFYLAEGTGYLPEGKVERARVLQWMLFEQFSHAPFVVGRPSSHVGSRSGREALC